MKKSKEPVTIIKKKETVKVTKRKEKIILSHKVSYNNKIIQVDEQKHLDFLNGNLSLEELISKYSDFNKK